LKRCQSFTDAETCLANVRWHLEKSSQHYADPLDVDILFETLKPETEEVPKHWFPETEEVLEPMPPSDAPPLHVLAKRQKVAVASGNQGSSSSASGGIGTNAVLAIHVDRTELTDTLTLRRSTLLTMLDSVERAAAAAKHAITISVVARDAFETEERRLADCARQLARICDR
jgi:hypothetical protein